MQRSGTDTFRSAESATPTPAAGQRKARNERRARIDAELVRLLYAQAPLGIATTLFVAGLVAFVHRDVLDGALVVGWFLGHMAVNVLRLLLVQAYGSDLHSKVSPKSWGSWYVLTSAGSGIAWGSAVLLVALSQSPSHQYFVAFVVGGVVSGALAVLSPLMKAYTVFSVLALLPVALWFLFQGDQIYFLMGLLGIVLLAVMLLTARRLNANLVQSLDLSFANAELASTVSIARDETLRVNRELEREVSARRRIEAWLKREKDRAQTTLHSLGDAVITTDASCRVDYVNPAAEELTGWTLGDAHGRPLEEVFRLRDKSDKRDESTDPVRHCLSEAVTQSFGDGMLRRKNDAELAVQHSWAPIRDPVGAVTGSVMVFRELSEQRPASGPISFEDSHDPLTGLINRSGFEDRLAHATRTAESQNLEHVLVCLNLGDYETVRDRHGDQAGEELLRRFGGLLQEQVREADAIARLSTNEFGVLLESCSLDSARSIVEKLKLAVADFRFVWAEDKLALAPRIRVTLVHANADLDSLLG